MVGVIIEGVFKIHLNQVAQHVLFDCRQMITEAKFLQ